jgi:hypothetical protein
MECDAFEALASLASSSAPVPEQTLRELADRLHREPENGGTAYVALA